MTKSKLFQFCMLTLLVSPKVLAFPNLTTFQNQKQYHPFYIGMTGGYGTTLWKGLVPPPNKQSLALSLSTPTSTKEGGWVWGFVAGYELMPTFALEASYTRYPNARVFFDDTSLFTFEHDGETELTTRTETFAAMGKFMIFIPCTDVRVYSSLGVADVHRYDSILDSWKLSPTFGAGVNYNFTDHIMGEIGMNYTSGYGQSEINPAEDYIPFIISGFLRLTYRI